jgi:hypothetical protein
MSEMHPTLTAAFASIKLSTFAGFGFKFNGSWGCCSESIHLIPTQYSISRPLDCISEIHDTFQELFETVCKPICISPRRFIKPRRLSGPTLREDLWHPGAVTEISLASVSGAYFDCIRSMTSDLPQAMTRELIGPSEKQFFVRLATEFRR